MKPFFKPLMAATLACAALAAQAHEGHGLLGSHWHTSDALGFVFVAALVGLVVWLSRK